MHTFSEQEQACAVRIWREECYRYEELEAATSQILKAKSFKPWLKMVRSATFKSTAQVAKKMNIPKAEYYRLEKTEVSEDISLRRLRQCAEALDCELIYFMRPAQGQNFSHLILQAIMPEALKVKAPQFSWTRINRLADRLVQLTHDPRFRQAQGWCRNVAGEGHAVTNMLRRIRI